MDSYFKDHDVVIDAAREERWENKIDNTINRTYNILLWKNYKLKEILHSHPIQKEVNKKFKRSFSRKLLPLNETL